MRPENKYKNQSIDFIDITKLSEKQTSVLALEGHKTIENTENFKLRECFSLLRHKSLVLLACQIMKRQLICQKLVRKLLIFSLLFFSVI